MVTQLLHFVYRALLNTQTDTLLWSATANRDLQSHGSHSNPSLDSVWDFLSIFYITLLTLTSIIVRIIRCTTFSYCL